MVLACFHCKKSDNIDRIVSRRHTMCMADTKIGIHRGHCHIKHAK